MENTIKENIKSNVVNEVLLPVANFMGNVIKKLPIAILDVVFAVNSGYMTVKLFWGLAKDIDGKVTLSVTGGGVEVLKIICLGYAFVYLRKIITSLQKKERVSAITVTPFVVTTIVYLVMTAISVFASVDFSRRQMQVSNASAVEVQDKKTVLGNDIVQLQDDINNYIALRKSLKTNPKFDKNGNDVSDDYNAYYTRQIKIATDKKDQKQTAKESLKVEAVNDNKQSAFMNFLTLVINILNEAGIALCTFFLSINGKKDDENQLNIAKELDADKTDIVKYIEAMFNTKEGVDRLNGEAKISDLTGFSLNKCRKFQDILKSTNCKNGKKLIVTSSGKKEANYTKDVMTAIVLEKF